jgi:23S rRNA (pseudouridine1915-N3)-methyltransferase
MIRITVACVGKIKEKYYQQAVEEYSKRLGRYCRLDIIQVADEKTPDNAPDSLNEKIRELEGRRLLGQIPQEAYVVALAIEGKQLDSPELAAFIGRLGVEGKSHIVIVIGGSLGLSDEVLRRADFKLSFSRMTFPHQLMRVILLEQVYRGFRILNNEPYHK